MKKKIGLGLITLNLTMASILGQLYSSVQKSFTHKSLYTLDVSPVVKTNQNIKKLINTSPIRISDSLKAKVDINTAKIVSSSSINQKIRHKTSVVKINPIKKFIPKYELAAVSSGTIAAVSDLSVKKIKVELKESIELKVTEPVELSAVTVHKSHIKKTKWLASYKPFKYRKFEPVIKRDFKTLSGSSKQSIAKKETFNKSNESKSLNIQNNKKTNQE